MTASGSYLINGFRRGTASVPIANHDNNQHTFNENIRIRTCGMGLK